MPFLTGIIITGWAIIFVLHQMQFHLAADNKTGGEFYTIMVGLVGITYTFGNVTLLVNNIP
jgi:hypothetical protein